MELCYGKPEATNISNPDTKWIPEDTILSICYQKLLQPLILLQRLKMEVVKAGSSDWYIHQVCEEVSVYKVRFYDTLSVKESLIFVAGGCITLASGERGQGFDPHSLQGRPFLYLVEQEAASLP
ncbi:hypothetical protein Tco_0291756 [Tanacetum coccineum]